MSTLIHKITNAHLVIQGSSMLGRLSEAELPKLEATLVEHDALGLLAKTKHFAGFEAMEATFRWNAFYPDVMILLADPYEIIQMSLYANMDVISSEGLTDQVSIVTHMRGRFTTSLPSSSYKQMENVDGIETMVQVQYIKQVIAGVEIIEFDALTNLHVVNGVDKTARYRNNLGL